MNKYKYPEGVTTPRQKATFRNRLWRIANPEKALAISRRNNTKRKEANKVYHVTKRKQERELAIEHYGKSCQCCGEDNYEFLCFDHINGGGHKHRKTIKSGNLARWLIKNNFPEGFRVLCHNCNMSLGFYGYCPHTRRM